MLTTEVLETTDLPDRQPFPREGVAAAVLN